jgi:hypothetical protein
VTTGLSDRASARAADALRALDYYRRGRSHPRALHAAGLRIDGTADRNMLRALGAVKQPWQRLAWNYRDLIGELRFALQFRARAISRMRFFVAEIQDGTEDEPLPVSLRHDDDPEVARRVTLPEDLCEVAETELARLPLDAGMAFLGVWSENFDVAGECWLYGQGFEDGSEHWEVKSSQQVEISPDGSSVYIIDAAAPGQRRKLDLSEEGREELYRLWVPHPVDNLLSDSALRATLDVLEDVVAIGREIRAAARSRFASNGVWMLPHGMMLPNGVKADADMTDPESNTFAADLTSAILAPISNEGDPGAMAPVIVVGHKEDIEAAKEGFIRFDREDSPILIDKLTAALTRMGNSLDLPPEVINGMGDANHWTAWQIDSATAKHHIDPSARAMADALTTAFLRPVLLKQGFAPADIRRLRVWFTLGSLTENPNRRQDALDAHDRGAIGNKTLRDALGFGEEDAPSQGELLAMLAMKQGLDAAWAAQVLAWYAEQEDPGGLQGLPMPPTATTSAPPQGRAAIPSQAAPAPAQRPASPTPQTAPTGVAASAVHTGLSGTPRMIIASGQHQPGYRLVHNDFERLLTVERAMRAKLTEACDQAVADAVRRAGSRTRAKLSRDREMSLAVKEIPSEKLCAHLGRSQTLALADLPFLLNGAFSELYDTYTAIMTGGLTVLADKLAKILKAQPDPKMRTRLTTALGQRLDNAWDYLTEALRARAERLMFQADPEDQPGEKFDTLVQPAVVRAALSVVGGLAETAVGVDERGRSISGEPLGGITGGQTFRDEIEEAGGVEVGYTWVYGITLQPDRFEPHWELEAQRFTGWTDPRLSTAGGRYGFVGPYFRPGDHEGCMCDYVPAWALPDYTAQVNERLRVPTDAMAQLITLAQQDDQAGRTGTTAQYERDRWQQVQQLQARFIQGEPA